MRRHRTFQVSLSAILFAVCMVFSVLAPLSVKAASYSGKGTVADPYLVTNAEQLQGMRENLSAHYKLANTIDLSGVDFKPIGRLDGPFTGTFVCELNADKTPKYAIKNLKVSVVAAPYASENKNKWEAALFGATKGATISGIYVLNVNISNEVVGDNTGSVVYNDYKPGMDEMNAAALIGQADGTTVLNCASTGTINAKSNNSGGLIGRCTDAIVENCYSSVAVVTSGKWQVGGLIAIETNSKISSCYSTGNVTGGQSSIAALCGRAVGGSFADCYSTGSVSGGEENKASFTTWGTGNDPQMSNCFSLSNVDQALENTTLSKQAANCWVLSGTTHNMNGFTVGTKEQIKTAFAGLSKWDTSGETPVLKGIGVVSDAGKYVPGAVDASLGTPSGTSGSATQTETATETITQTQTTGAEEVVKMIEALPDPKEEGAVTLDCLEAAMEAYEAYEALDIAAKDSFDAALASKLSQVRYQLSLLMASDVVTQIKKLPAVKDLTDKDTEHILDLWKKYNFLDDELKNEIDKELVEKMEAAYEFAMEHSDGTEVDIQTLAPAGTKLTTLEWFIVIFGGSIIVLAIAFDVFAGVWMFKQSKKKLSEH